MRPIGEGVRYQTGQFAYLDFNLDKVNHFHPFTITSTSEEKELSVVIRNLGKHTQTLQTDLKLGQPVTVDGGYGQLARKRKTNKPQIWLAGGIGITPFISWIKAMTKPQQETHLFFVGRGQFYTLMVEKVVALIGNKQIHLHTQATIGEVLTAKTITNKITQPLSDYQVFGCGPTPMLTDLKAQLINEGLKPSDWHNENFVMR